MLSNKIAVSYCFATYGTHMGLCKSRLFAHKKSKSYRGKIKKKSHVVEISSTIIVFTKKIFDHF